MVKFLASGDWHLRSYGSFQPFNVVEANGLTRELNNALLGLKLKAKTILEKRPEVVIIMGDVFHHPEGQDARTIHAAALAMGWIREACDEVGAVLEIFPGQHDIFSEAHGITCLDTLCRYGSLSKEFVIKERQGVTYAIVPYCSDKERLYQWLLEAQAADLIFAHLDVMGARYENGALSESQVSPNLSKPCFAGDIHLAQEVGAVVYSGSMVQNRFNRYDLDGVGGMLCVEADGVGASWSRILNDQSRHYIKVRDVQRFLEQGIPPERCVLQVITDQDRGDVEGLLGDYEWTYMPAERTTDESNLSGGVDRSDPESLMRAYLAENHPELLETFEGVKLF